MGAWKAIFEGGFNFAASEVRNKFYGTASSVQRKEDRYASPSIKEYQNLEGKLKYNLTGEWSGDNCGAIGEWLWSEYKREQREWLWSEYERVQRLAIASKRILWHSVCLTWNYVDLRRKYTRRTQDGRKRPIQGPWPDLSTQISRGYCLRPVLSRDFGANYSRILAANYRLYDIWWLFDCNLQLRTHPPLDFCTMIVHEIILSKSIGPTKSISDKKA